MMLLALKEAVCAILDEWTKEWTKETPPLT
jgi:hypothetical protein